jgi:hypothetical protein
MGSLLKTKCFFAPWSRRAVLEHGAQCVQVFLAENDHVLLLVGVDDRALDHNAGSAHYTKAGDLAQLFNFGELDAYAIVFGDFFDQCDCAFAFRAACAEKLDVQDVSLNIKVEFLFR